MRHAPAPSPYAKLWTGVNALMMLVFLFSVVVQFNDPDPLKWSVPYGLAAAACALEMRRKRIWLLPAGLAAGTLAWALVIAPQVVGRVPLGSLFSAFEMRDVGVELAREMGGLLIVASWMAVLAWSAARRGREANRRGLP